MFFRYICLNPSDCRSSLSFAGVVVVGWCCCCCRGSSVSKQTSCCVPTTYFCAPGCATSPHPLISRLGARGVRAHRRDGARRNSDAAAWMCGVGSGSSPAGRRSGATLAPTEYCLGYSLPQWAPSSFCSASATIWDMARAMMISYGWYRHALEQSRHLWVLIWILPHFFELFWSRS